MNDLTFEECEVGMQESFLAYITWDMMEKFRVISGDDNPLHCDAKFAKEKGFHDRVAYGMLTASLYSRLAGMYLPGKNCLLQSVYSDFLCPVYVTGQPVSVSGTIIEKHESVKQLVIKAVIYAIDGKKVSRATITAGVLE